MSETQHSPTPWRVDEEIYVVDRGGLAVVVHVPMSRKVRGVAAANAALIVRAVNQHDTLVSLLREFVGLYDGARDSGKTVTLPGELVDRMRDAIKKGEGGS